MTHAQQAEFDAMMRRMRDEPEKFDFWACRMHEFIERIAEESFTQGQHNMQEAMQ